MEVKPGYKQTEVGVIPEDWEVSPLEKFTSFISYGFTNPMPTSVSGVYMIRQRISITEEFNLIVPAVQLMKPTEPC